MDASNATTRTPRPASRRMRVFLAPLILIGAAIPAYLFWLAPSWERTEALELARKGEFERAEPLLKKSLDRRPADPEVLEALTRGWLKAGDEPAAAESLDRWIAAAPQDPQPLRIRIEQRTKRREYDLALADGLALRELAPADANLRKQILGFAFSAGEFETAEKLCREAMQAEPNDLTLRVRLAGIRAARGDRTGAVELLEGIVKEHPGQTGAMQTLAMLYNELERPEQAIPLLRSIMDTDPTRQRTAGYQLSLALERTGRSDEAKKVLAEVRRRQDAEVFRKAVESQPDNLELRTRLAESLLLDGHADDGLAMLGEVLARDPVFRFAHRVLAEHYRRTGDTAKAERHRTLAEAPR